MTRPEEKMVRCPLCPARARLRHGKRGWFYGCSRYPACRGTKPVELTETVRALRPRERGVCCLCGGAVVGLDGEAFTDGGREYVRHVATHDGCASMVIASTKSR